MRHRTNEQGKSNAGMARIAERARAQKKERFSNLLHHLTPELIEEKLKEIPLNSSTGIDKLMVEETRNNLSWLLPPVLEQIHKGIYKPPAVRRVYVPKPQGGQRPIGIPTVLDRAIQGAMAEILNGIYEQDFLNCSYGFRPNRNCHNALATVCHSINRRQMETVLEVDVRSFFDTISHGWLMKFLKHRISDKRVLKQIKAWLKAGVVTEGKEYNTVMGTPQGGSISPLLANIYLHYTLDLWWDRRMKKQLKAEAQLVRYADDFVFLFQDPADVDIVQRLLKVRLEQFGLSIAEDKTGKANLSKQQGKRGIPRRIKFLGFTIVQTPSRNGKGWKVVFRTESGRFTRAKRKMKKAVKRAMHWNIKQQISYINSILRGHFNYYGLPGNSRRLECFWHQVVRYWHWCLSKRSQRGYITWENMQPLLLKLVRPKLKISYWDINKYVIL
jgi:group II intron reverse transcriptase/maturase